MIRFIFQREIENGYGALVVTFETVDIDVPELEAIMKRGGQGNGGPGHDITRFMGVELRVLQEKTS